MWERTLKDLIRGLRANKKDEAKFISHAIDEIRTEIKSKDMDLKAAAVLKLTYLDMLGYDMKWASFHVVEVMSSPKFHLKSVGYLAAVQSFSSDTDVLMLTTNLLKKDLSSTPTDIAISLNGLSHIASPDLSRDLSHDLVAMLNHSRAHIRKRAVLALYKVFQRYPEALQHNFPRLREKLEDPDPGVVAATVNVLCELALRNPTDYLPLAPQLFHILTTSTNNWMLIKIIKLFGALTPHEPRLVKKLQPPITNLISTTPAISLLYECVRTSIIGGMLQGHQGDALARTCVTKLAAFLEDADQNLKYIALLAMVKIVPSHPHLVAEYQEIILSIVDDADISIRMRALELISEMVTPSSLQSIVQQLLSHLTNPTSSQPSASHALSLLSYSVTPNATSPPSSSPLTSPAYRHLLTHRILSIASKDGYANVEDFEWYFAVLIDLAYVSPVPGSALRDALLDVAVRVRAIRGYAVKLCSRLLGDDTFVTNAAPRGNLDESGDILASAEVLRAAAWICGEYSRELSDPPKVIGYLLQTTTSSLLNETISVYIQAALKIFGSWAVDLAGRWHSDFLSELRQTVDMVISGLQSLISSEDIEVQERAANTLQLFTFVKADLSAFKPKVRPLAPTVEFDNAFADAPLPSEPHFPKSLYLISPLTTSYELNPVAREAQGSVPVPEGLDLDSWIIPPPKEESKLEAAHTAPTKKKKGKGKEKAENGEGKAKKQKTKTISPVNVPEETVDERAERERRRAERLERLKDDPYYLIDDQPRSTPPHQDGSEDDIDLIPVVKLDGLTPPLSRSASTSRLRQPRPAVETGGEMPEGALLKPFTPSAPATAAKLLLQSVSSMPSLSSFPQYDEEEGARTPDPIKVVRVKKKGTGKKKKPKEVNDNGIP
ncbi:Adaptor protein complex AP-3 delta subunit [Hysterangium stoloniferum]|nr:Adaptor protein complex AP-3 delta subunit [Hysterangium stoloniferum]